MTEEMSFKCCLQIVRDSAFRMGVGSSFHQPGTVNENVLESDFVSLSVMAPRGDARSQISDFLRGCRLL